jgi:hypothetical protein
MKSVHILLALAFAALCRPMSAGAQPAVVDPFGPLGQAVRVTGLAVPNGPAQGFLARQEAVLQRGIDETIAARGRPRLIDTLREHRGTLLVYPDGLVMISGYYSTRIVCRIEVATGPLRDSVDVERLVALAARACRNAEVRGWGRESLPAVHAIGTAQLPGSGGIGLSIVATNTLDTLLDDLVRRTQIERGTAATLVRSRYDGDDSYSMERGFSQWRYAWFTDGHFVAVRQDIPPNEENSYGAVRLTCVVPGPARALPALDSGPIATWCEANMVRLRPWLAPHVAAVRQYEREQEARRPPPAAPMMPSSGGTPFHRLDAPPGLIERLWAQGLPAGQ